LHEEAKDDLSDAPILHMDQEEREEIAACVEEKNSSPCEGNE
jgi:hypothetical protein